MKLISIVKLSEDNRFIQYNHNDKTCQEFSVRDSDDSYLKMRKNQVIVAEIDDNNVSRQLSSYSIFDENNEVERDLQTIDEYELYKVMNNVVELFLEEINA